MQTENIAEIVIDALGGTSALASEMSLTPSTVSSWKTSGRIPKWRWPIVAEIARKRGIDLPTQDAAA